MISYLILGGMVMKRIIKEKLEKIVSLVNNVMVDPDIDVDYCIPEVETTLDNCNVSGDPYILVKCIKSKYNQPTRKIILGRRTLLKTPEDIANQITLSIIEFKIQIDSIDMGLNTP